LLVVNAGSIERNNQVIKDSMKDNMEWIRRTMAANDLEPAGAMQIVSLEMGRETYTFHVRQPVRRAGSGGDEATDEAADEAAGEVADSAAPADADAEGDAGEAPKDEVQHFAKLVAASGEPLEGLKLQG